MRCALLSPMSPLEVARPGVTVNRFVFRNVEMDMPVEKVAVRLANSFHVHVERHIFHADRDSVILINGALATTASFGQTIKYMSAHHNVLCFDLPYAGQSRQHNKRSFLLSKDDEVDILLELIHRYKPGYLCSVSWGGLAALLALSRGASSIRRAAICSFSPYLNDAMVRYITTARDLLSRGENKAAAHLLNDTVGRNLPRIVKLLNYRYLTSLPKEEQDQVAFHVDQILALQPDVYLPQMSNIRCQVKFINGMLDEHTTARDIRQISTYVKGAQFAAIPDAGHFLDLEGRSQAAAVRDEILGFYGEPVQTAAPVLVAAAAQEQTFAPLELNTSYGA
ncbi:rhamnosyltransferase subunit A [Paraburkholderia megapolitana]|uniref:Rhamnosyltransferase subunit A n=2 Tax=Burkholderiaceae TaxID=119060 RepID=A0A1I3DDE0_9BURK|nr:rhamnosyltransferase subunit A [Paraburkholderia megapolitana]